MSGFKPGQLVRQSFNNLASHYAVVLSPDYTVGWVSNSTLEVKPTTGQQWEIVKTKYPALPLERIKESIKAFKKQLKTENPPVYNVVNFNCEHWATWMITGRSYSTQIGAAQTGTMTMLGGGMVAIGSSAGTVVTAASLLGASASTGTAISTLSGAAATNAALAWLGGGTLAAGGGGVATGALIVGAVTTLGVGTAIVGAGIIGHQIWQNIGQQERRDAMRMASAPSASSKVHTQQMENLLDQLLDPQ
jgi:phage-related tail protein